MSSLSKSTHMYTHSANLGKLLRGQYLKQVFFEGLQNEEKIRQLLLKSTVGCPKHSALKFST